VGTDLPSLRSKSLAGRLKWLLYHFWVFLLVLLDDQAIAHPLHLYRNQVDLLHLVFYWKPKQDELNTTPFYKKKYTLRQL
jgi:hypothetical protein